MSKTDVEAIKRDLAEINSFVSERIDPVAQEVSLLTEETGPAAERVGADTGAGAGVAPGGLARETGAYESPLVTDGPYAGMDVLDLGLLRRLARSQAREAAGPAWLERAEQAKRSLVGNATPAAIEESHQAAARRLSDWYTVADRGTGQFESFGRSMLQSMTRAAMDSTTAGAGDELVATLEARELWLDVNLQTLVAPLVRTISMPSNPFEMPRQLGDVNFYPGARTRRRRERRWGRGRRR